jgi:16S rRNA (guanine(966)-N(2))-methyltransferase RsmD
VKGILRVVGGSARGLRLKSVPGDTTRPITDIVKEALFNIIGGDIIDNEILDLFGGTGAVGIEALSRGAKFVTFLEKSQQAVQTIKGNLKTTHFSDKARVLCVDAFGFLSGQSGPYDLIYVAPPQYKEMWQRAMRLLNERPELLRDDGQVIVQINPIEWDDSVYQHFEVFDRRKYGDTLLVFYEKSPLEAHD